MLCFVATSCQYCPKTGLCQCCSKEAEAEAEDCNCQLTCGEACGEKSKAASL